MPTIILAQHNLTLSVPQGANLLETLRKAGIYPDAPCSGAGTCGKCRVRVDGAQVLACQSRVQGDISVTLPEDSAIRILSESCSPSRIMNPLKPGYPLAIDIGTTTVVCYLLDAVTGEDLAVSSMTNPQAAFGADVISRIRCALHGEGALLTQAIRECVNKLIQTVCVNAGISPDEIGVVSLVGNPAMRQLFLGISPENLAAIPYTPVFTAATTLPFRDILPLCPNGILLLPPDPAGFIGTDTLGCMLASGLSLRDELTLLVDIGTNGEMVLGSKDGLVACSTAAGPALEGANIRFGMRAANGAIDHVWMENGEIRCSVIGGGKAIGICGSGLLDAIALGLDTGCLNKRGKILNKSGILPLTGEVCLTQNDIRQVQLAKGSICAGIRLMAAHLGYEAGDIQRVLLAGAFGSHLNPDSACRIGLLPEELRDRCEPIGNAAGSGGKMLACDRNLLAQTDVLCQSVDVLELSALDGFPRRFALDMNFREELQ